MKDSAGIYRPTNVFGGIRHPVSDRTNRPHGALTVNMFVGFAGPIGPIGYISISVYSSNEHNLGKKPAHRPVQALQLGSE